MARRCTRGWLEGVQDIGWEVLKRLARGCTRGGGMEVYTDKKGAKWVQRGARGGQKRA